MAYLGGGMEGDCPGVALFWGQYIFFMNEKNFRPQKNRQREEGISKMCTQGSKFLNTPLRNAYG